MPSGFGKGWVVRGKGQGACERVICVAQGTGEACGGGNDNAGRVGSCRAGGLFMGQDKDGKPYVCLGATWWMFGWKLAVP